MLGSAVLAQHWFIACRSKELRPRRVVKRELLGTNVALFRSSDGVAHALRDVCPHRTVPLSAGFVDGETLVCRYHGWAFDGSGTCRAVPGLEGDTSRRTRDALAYPVREQDGFVWVYATPGEEPRNEPHRFEFLTTKGYRSMVLQFDAVGELPDILENFLDTTHTHFLHRGLIRRDSQRKRTSVIVERGVDRVAAEYIDDGQDSGVIARLFGGGVDTSIDRFVLPSVVQLEHSSKGVVVLMITLFFTPENATKAKVYAVGEGRTGPLRHWLALTVGRLILSRVIRQDRGMLELQHENRQRFPHETYTTTQLDILRPHVLRLLREPAVNGTEAAPPQRREVQLYI
jgi:phenylpropionate dioxygenase-like ring-hydroxylating dioxygenase large terminal subunit